MSFDLHMHSDMSDGSDTIRQLLEHASKMQIRVLSVTDHDHAESYRIAKPIADELGISIIPGIEISAYDFDSAQKVHILGYGYKDSYHIEKLCNPILQRRDERSNEQLNLLTKEGYPIELTKLNRSRSSHRTLYKQEIMYAMTGLRYRDEGYSKLYVELFKGGGICAGDISYVSVVDAIDAIHHDGGLAFIAHPGQSKSFGEIPKYVQLGLDGIEAYHPDHEEDDVMESLKIAEEYSLLISGGSDYHGLNGGSPDLIPYAHDSLYKTAKALGIKYTF